MTSNFMDNKPKKLILIDLDGVLNTYTGAFKPDFIPPLKDGAENFIKKLNNDYELKLFTTRNKILVSKWLFENNISNYFSDTTNTKELCWLFLDDRCICFEGDYKKLRKQIKDFQPWYKIHK